MDPKQATELGAYLRKHRERKGVGTHILARLSGVQQTTILRFEHGAHLSPDPQKLRLLAVALGLDPADVLTRAAYPVPTDLLTPKTYLRTKYRNLPAARLQAIQREVADVLERHGINPNAGPEPGEDE